MQETFLVALRSRSYRGEAEVGTWLHRILVNKCIDRMRAERRRPLADPAQRLVDRPLEGADPSTTVPDRLLISDAIALLAPEQRAVVALVRMECYSVAEVAAILEIPPGTVKSRCARAVARLIELIGDQKGGPR